MLAALRRVNPDGCGARICFQPVIPWSSGCRGVGCKVFSFFLCPIWLNHGNCFVHPLAALLSHLWARFSYIADHYRRARSRRRASARRSEARFHFDILRMVPSGQLAIQQRGKPFANRPAGRGATGGTGHRFLCCIIVPLRLRYNCSVIRTGSSASFWRHY